MMEKQNKTIASVPSGQKASLGAWLRLLLGVVVLLIFMFIIAPAGLNIPGFRSMSELIEEKNLRATALYYTDIDEFGEAAVTLRNNREYTPQGNDEGGHKATARRNK
jgi:hypothetical protein